MAHNFNLGPRGHGMFILTIHTSFLDRDEQKMRIELAALLRTAAASISVLPHSNGILRDPIGKIVGSYVLTEPRHD